MVNLYRCENQIVNDAYDRTVVNIYLQKGKNGYKTFVICGAEPGVGTTSISAELAIAFSIAGWKTVLVDGDFRKTRNYKRLNDSAEIGLAEYVDGTADEKSIIMNTNWKQLSYIAAGNKKDDSPVRILCSTRMENLLNNLHEEYDYVIVDAPSFTASVDANILSVKADAVILVAEAEKTRRKNVEQAIKKFKENGSNVIGIIENKVTMGEYQRYLNDFDYFKDKKYVSKGRSKRYAEGKKDEKIKE